MPSICDRICSQNRKTKSSEQIFMSNVFSIFSVTSGAVTLFSVFKMKLKRNASLSTVIIDRMNEWGLRRANTDAPWKDALQTLLSKQYFEVDLRGWSSCHCAKINLEITKIYQLTAHLSCWCYNRLSDMYQTDNASMIGLAERESPPARLLTESFLKQEGTTSFEWGEGWLWTEFHAEPNIRSSGFLI